MQNHSTHYFLTATAIKIWQANDDAEERRMFACLCEEKKAYFGRVVYKNAPVQEYKLIEFAETAFLTVWMDCRVKARAGALNVYATDYRGFFYQAFKNNYLKLVEKETRLMAAERTFSLAQPGAIFEEDEPNPEIFSTKTQHVLHKINEGCRELLTQRYVHNLSYDEIVEKRQDEINRSSAIKNIIPLSETVFRNLEWVEIM